MKIKIFFAETLRDVDTRKLMEGFIAAVPAEGGGMDLICRDVPLVTNMCTELYGISLGVLSGCKRVRVAVEMREDRGVSNLLESLANEEYEVEIIGEIPWL